jgi:hypothetical protein
VSTTFWRGWDVLETVFKWTPQPVLNYYTPSNLPYLRLITVLTVGPLAVAYLDSVHTLKFPYLLNFNNTSAVTLSMPNFFLISVFPTTKFI